MIKKIFFSLYFKTNNLKGIYNLKFELILKIKFNNSYLNATVICYNY